jgi:hypothetical protein
MEGASGERCAAWGGNQLMEMVEKLSMGEECVPMVTYHLLTDVLATRWAFLGERWKSDPPEIDPFLLQVR